MNDEGKKVNCTWEQSFSNTYSVKFLEPAFNGVYIVIITKEDKVYNQKIIVF